MNPNRLKAGIQCMLADGSVVEVRHVLSDNATVEVSYLDSLDNPEIAVGAVRQISFEEIIGEYMGTHAEGLT